VGKAVRPRAGRGRSCGRRGVKAARFAVQADYSRRVRTQSSRYR
jgi:hypothetical protein